MAVWRVDSLHTTATFAVTHMRISTVRGRMGNITGFIEFDPDKPHEGKVEVTIDVSSLDTGVIDRDNHLRSADFFDVENHPFITFKSTKVDVDDDATGKIYGDLTIRGITRPVVLETNFLGSDIHLEHGLPTIGFEATTRVNREDFGLRWNVDLDSGGVLVGRQVRITLDVEAIAVPESKHQS